MENNISGLSCCPANFAVRFNQTLYKRYLLSKWMNEWMNEYMKLVFLSSNVVVCSGILHVGAIYANILLLF